MEPTDRRRRGLLLAGAALLAFPMIAVPRRAGAAMAAERSLAFRHAHTGETLSIAYAAGGQYLPEAMQQIDWLLRDFRRGETHPIDPQLLDQLHTLASITGAQAPYEIISGYRSPATNASLRKRRGVARNSLHLEGRAIDIRLADVRLADLRDAALSLKAGGVGYYARSNFVHVDTGRVRRW